MLNLLSELRGRCASVGLSESGGLSVKGVPNDQNLIAQVRANKDGLVKAIRSESLTGPLYAHSAMRYEVERLVGLLLDHRRADIATAKCDLAIKWLWSIDDAGWESGLPAAAALEVQGYQGFQLLLIDIESEKRSKLSGSSLVSAVKEVFGLAIDKPVERNVQAFA